MIPTEIVQELLFEKPLPVLTIDGRSMLPYFQNGEKVRLHPLTQPLLIGRCYAYRQHNHITLHRLCAILPNGTLLFAGDNAIRIERIQPRQLLGELQETAATIFGTIRTRINRFFVQLGIGRTYRRWFIAPTTIMELLYEKALRNTTH